MDSKVGIYKVILIEDEGYEFIPEQPADKKCPFIHACDFSSILNIVTKFYTGQSVAILRINVEMAIREGFDVKYEGNSGVKYWHFYRPVDEPTKLLSAKCIMKCSIPPPHLAKNCCHHEA